MLKHTLQGMREDEEIKCRNCGEKFFGKSNLMIHRKQTHINTVADCKNNQEGKCLFTSDKCWWNHNKNSDSISKRDSKMNCYVCSKTFETKSEMMIHRKIKHADLVKVCHNFKKNNCKLQNKFCWFLHKDEEDIVTDTEALEKENKNTEDITEKESSVFQNVSGNLKPPIARGKSKQKME